MGSPAADAGARRRAELLFFALAGLVLAPLVLFEYVPGVDYPTHLSMLRILRLSFEDPQGFGAVFGTRLAQPYWGFYAPALLLSSILSIDTAAKLVLAAVLLLPALAVRALAREEGASPVAPILALAATYGFGFYWGFAPFLAGNGLALLGLVHAVRFARDEDGRSLLALHAFSLLVFVAQGASLAFWMLFTGWIFLTRGRRLTPSFALRAASIHMLPLALLQLWRMGVERWGNYAWSLHHRVRVPQSVRRTELADALLVTPGFWVAVSFLLAFAGLVALHLRAEASRGRLLRWGGLAAGMLAAYFVLPADAAGLNFFYHRFPGYALVFLPLCMAAAPVRAGLPLAATLVTAVTIGHVLLFRAFDREIAGLRSCLAAAGHGSSLLGLMYDRSAPGLPHPVLLHADNYHVHWNLGRVYTHSMEMLPTTPVYFRDRTHFDGPPPAFDWVPQRFDYTRMARNVDYFLVHGPPDAPVPGLREPPLVDQLLLGQGFAHSRLVCQSGRFRLYRNLSVDRGPSRTMPGAHSDWSLFDERSALRQRRPR